MQKHLANPVLFPAKADTPLRSWSLALKSWREAYQLRKAERKCAEVLAGLTPEILYDIGEIDCKARAVPRTLLDAHPHRFVIDAMMGCNRSKPAAKL